MTTRYYFSKGLVMTIKVDMPEPLKSFVKNQVGRGKFRDASEYLQALVREDRKRHAQEKLEDMLLEGLNSGPPITMDDEYFRRKKERLLARNGRKKKS